jgi:hypothetical protein
MSPKPERINVSPLKCIVAQARWTGSLVCLPAAKEIGLVGLL